MRVPTTIILLSLLAMAQAYPDDNKCLDPSIDGADAVIAWANTYGLSETGSFDAYDRKKYSFLFDPIHNHPSGYGQINCRDSFAQNYLMQPPTKAKVRQCKGVDLSIGPCNERDVLEYQPQNITRARAVKAVLTSDGFTMCKFTWWHVSAGKGCF